MSRTVYRVTESGQSAQRRREVLQRRLAAHRDARQGLRAELERLRPRLAPTAPAVVEHVLVRHETDVRWHPRRLEQVDSLDAQWAPLDADTS